MINDERLFSRASEAAVIGSTIIDPDCIEKILAIIDVKDFAIPEHKIILQTVFNLHDSGKTIDGLMLRERLSESNRLEKIGGVEYLQKILDSVPTSANALHYAEIVKEKSRFRRLVSYGEHANEIIEATNGSVGETVWKIQQITAGLQGAVEGFASTPIVRNLDGVKVKPINWLWYNRIPCGMFTLIFGNPGIYKSWMTLDWAARVSTGGRWPDGSEIPDNRAPLGSVILLSAEDPLEEVVKPRLLSLGADPKNIYALEAVRVRDKQGRQREEFFNLQDDLSALRQAIRPDTKLIIIDPISAYYGQGVDSHRDGDIRGVLAPLIDLAEQTSIAVVGITHLNKNVTGKAVYRALGSIGIMAAARTAWLISEDPEQPETRRRLLIPAKHNVLVDPTGLAFEVVDGRIVYETEPVSTTADEALYQSGVSAPERDKCAEWLETVLLPDKSINTTMLQEQAREQGFTPSTLRRAKDKLGVKSYPLNTPTGRAWFCELKTQVAQEGAQQNI